MHEREHRPDTQLKKSKKSIKYLIFLDEKKFSKIKKTSTNKNQPIPLEYVALIFLL